MVSSVDTRPKNIDSLLRFFQSDYFRSEIFYLMHYLYHDERPGIQDYLVNQLYEKYPKIRSYLRDPCWHDDSFFASICFHRPSKKTGTTHRSDMEIDFYLCQLVQICVARLSDPKLHGARQSLSKFLIWKAKQSVHFALKIHWLAISVFEEAAQTKALKIAGDTLIDQVTQIVRRELRIDSATGSTRRNPSDFFRSDGKGHRMTTRYPTQKTSLRSSTLS